METKMEIRANSQEFFVVENNEKIAYIRLVGNNLQTKPKKSLIEEKMFIDFDDQVSEEKKTEVKEFCNLQKDTVYRIVASLTKSGHAIYFLYLNGNYEKVAEFVYKRLLIFNTFSEHTTEIEQYVNENFIENFIICPS